MSNQKWRSGIMATGFAAVIMVGTLTGAQLKTDKQKKEQIQKFRETSPDEQIDDLQEQRKTLVQQRGLLQRNLDIFKDKAQKRADEKRRKKEASDSKP